MPRVRAESATIGGDYVTVAGELKAKENTDEP